MNFDKLQYTPKESKLAQQGIQLLRGCLSRVRTVRSRRRYTKFSAFLNYKKKSKLQILNGALFLKKVRFPSTFFEFSKAVVGLFFSQNEMEGVTMKIFGENLSYCRQAETISIIIDFKA